MRELAIGLVDLSAMERAKAFDEFLARNEAQLRATEIWREVRRDQEHEAKLAELRPGVPCSEASERILRRSSYVGPVDGWEVHSRLYQARKAMQPEPPSFVPDISRTAAALHRAGPVHERL